MYRLYCKGATLAAVGLEHGISGERVRQLFRDAGLPTRSVAETAELQRRNQDLRSAAIAHRLRETSDLDFVAAEFGIAVAEAERMIRETSPELLGPVRRGGDRVPMGFWTRQRVIDAISRWNDLYGKPPNATDWNPAQARRLGHDERAARFDEGLWPYVTTVLSRFDSWNAAIRAAGLEPTRVSSYGRPGDNPEIVMRGVEQYREGDSLSKAAATVGISQMTLTKALTAAGVPLPGERLVERIKAFLRDRDWTPAKTINYALPDASVHVYSALQELRRDPELEFLEMSGRGVFVRLRRDSAA